MSEFKQPISQMMSELEGQSREISREKIKAKSQELVESLQNKATANAMKIWSLIRLGEARGEIDAEDEAEALRRLEQYMKDLSIPDKTIEYFNAITYALEQSHKSNKLIFGDDFDVLQAVLDEKVILPTTSQCEKVLEKGYHNLLIIPPVYFENIAKYLPEGVTIKADEVNQSAESGDILNRKRPRQFYTIATLLLPWNGNSMRARRYKEMAGAKVKASLREELESPENKELNLKGLTIGEFIMINLYEATKLLNSGQRLEIKDEYPLNDSATYFLGDSLGATCVVAGRTFRETPGDGWGINIFEKSVGATGSFPPVAAHFGDYHG